jgi:hypothetical protein
MLVAISTLVLKDADTIRSTVDNQSEDDQDDVAANPVKNRPAFMSLW